MELLEAYKQKQKQIEAPKRNFIIFPFTDNTKKPPNNILHSVVSCKYKPQQHRILQTGRLYD